MNLYVEDDHVRTHHSNSLDNNLAVCTIMKAIILKHSRHFQAPYCAEITAMINQEQERRVQFPENYYGYQLDNNQIIAPHFFKESIVVGKKVMQYVGGSSMGYSLFTSPVPHDVIPFSSRKKKVGKDTFIFRVNKKVELVTAKLVGRLSFEVKPDDFAILFDRHANFIGFTLGSSNNQFFGVLP